MDTTGNSVVKAKHPGGRPRVVVDLVMVKKLAGIQCTVAEIGAVLGIPKTTLFGRADFQEVYQQGLECGKASLRRLQYRLAERSAAMAIFLGKNHLGQRDDQFVRGEGLATRTVIYNIVHPEKLLSESERNIVSRPVASPREDSSMPTPSDLEEHGGNPDHSDSL